MSYEKRQVYAAATEAKGLYLLAYGLEAALLLVFGAENVMQYGFAEQYSHELEVDHDSIQSVLSVGNGHRWHWAMPGRRCI
jgi:hypothetical protein